jgi:hypothetical protein
MEEVPPSPEEQRKLWDGFFEEVGLPSVWDVCEPASDVEDEERDDGAGAGEDVEGSQPEGGEPGLGESANPEEDAESPTRNKVYGSGSPPKEGSHRARDDVEGGRESKRHRLE